MSAPAPYRRQPVTMRDSVRTRAEFAALRADGRRSRRRSIQVLWRPAGPGDEAADVRIAFTVGRPVGSAVVRNRLRRRLRADLRTSPPAPGTYLVVVTPAAASRSGAELRAELRACLQDLEADNPGATR